MKGLAAYGVRSDAAAMGVQRDAGGDLMLATIRANAPDYAFYGGLGLADDGTWTDVMRGVVATSAARPTIGTSGGRRAASFNGSQGLQTAAFASAISNYAVVVVCDTTGVYGATDQFVWDGLSAPANRGFLAYQRPTNKLIAGTLTTSSGYPDPIVATCIVAAEDRQLLINGSVVASSTQAAAALDGMTIGNRATLNQGLRGVVALLAIFSGTNYAARAAAIATMARSWYGTG